MKQAQEAATHTSQTWEKLGQDIGQTIEQAALFGRSWTDALKAILIELAEVIVKMTLMKNLQGASGGGGGFLSSLLGGLFGGKFADGGQLGPGQWGIAGENGPEPIFGGLTGMTVFPAASSHSNSAQVVYNIDARGADPGSELRIRAALRETENRAVIRSVSTITEMNRR
jgi:hypothetical protein